MSLSLKSSPGEQTPRRPPGQPKSGRKQYTACGACRMRRVRCDLKDLQAKGEMPRGCSNCLQRGLNCVDEYADIKASRQGGSASPGSEGSGSRNPSTSNSFVAIASNAYVPPTKDLLHSLLLRHIGSQRSIFDTLDFDNHTPAAGITQQTISVERQVLSMVFVAWASSFGLDHRGGPIDLPSLIVASGQGPGVTPRSLLQSRTHMLVNEILGLVDAHGILRNPTWDGARALLLLWPLTQGVQSHLERTTFMETVLSQINALCRFEGERGKQTGTDAYYQAIACARVFWYAYSQEGMTNGLRGGRLVLKEEDRVTLEQLLPPSLSQPHAPQPIASMIESMGNPRYLTSRPLLLYQLITHQSNLLLQTSDTCRRINAVLTGPRPRRLMAERRHSVEAQDLMSIWSALDRSWEQFDNVRQTGAWNAAVNEAYSVEEVDTFISGYHIFLFECHNIVREALKQLVVIYSPSSTEPSTSTPLNPYATTVAEFHHHAAQRCNAILPNVLMIIRRHTQARSSSLFRYDTGLVKDGCSFAGLLLANSDLEESRSNSGLHPSIDVEEGLGLCAQALDAMHWACSSNERAKQTLMSVWEARKTRDRVQTEKSHRASAGWLPSSSSSSPWLHAPSPAYTSPERGMSPTWDRSSPHYTSFDFVPADDSDELTRMLSSGSWSDYGHGN